MATLFCHGRVQFTGYTRTLLASVVEEAMNMLDAAADQVIHFKIFYHSIVIVGVIFLHSHSYSCHYSHYCQECNFKFFDFQVELYSTTPPPTPSTYHLIFLFLISFSNILECKKFSSRSFAHTADR